VWGVRYLYRILVGKPAKNKPRDMDVVDGTGLMLKRTLEKGRVRMWIKFNWLRIETSDGLL
jgi:hypothetical protein